MCVYLCIKFKVSNITITSFRQEGGGRDFAPPPTSEQTPKSPPKLGLRKTGNLPPDILAY